MRLYALSWSSSVTMIMELLGVRLAGESEEAATGGTVDSVTVTTPDLRSTSRSRPLGFMQAEGARSSNGPRTFTPSEEGVLPYPSKRHAGALSSTGVDVSTLSSSPCDVIT
jgi:hypothetical protein